MLRPAHRIRSLARFATFAVLLMPYVLASAAGAAISGACAGPLMVLVDRSGSMGATDPIGELRVGLGDALGRRRPAIHGDVVVPFSGALGEPVPADGGWPAAVDRAMLGGDSGPTDLDAVLGLAAGDLSRTAGGERGGLIVITDGEAELSAAPAALRAVITVGGPLGEASAAAVRAVGGRVAQARSAAALRPIVAELCGAVPASRADVVLLSGLGSRTRGLLRATTPAACGRADDLRRWCDALVRAGHRVSVPSAAPRGRGDVVVDSTGPLAENAQSLRQWLRGVGGRPVLVGHSMGGLIAHAAINAGAHATALLTIGTPHAGSYGADAVQAAGVAAAGCRALCPSLAALLGIAATGVRARYGAALDDLTRVRRVLQAPLGTTGVPLAVWAGVPNAVPGLPAGLAASAIGADYVVPNDGIVGRGSATGRLAGLSPIVTVDDGRARHSSSVPPRGAETELASADVAQWIVRTTEELASRRAPAVRQRLAGNPSSNRQGRAWAGRARRAVRVRLRAVAPIEVGATATPADDDAVIVATAPMGVLCDEHPLPLVEVGSGLWYLDLGELGCARIARPLATLSPPGGAVLIGARAGEQQREARLSATPVRTGWRVTVSSTVAGRLELRRGRHAVIAVRSSRGEWGGTRWRAELPLRGARRLRARLRVSGRSDLVGEVTLR